MQVDPIKPTLKLPGTKPFKLTYNIPLSSLLSTSTCAATTWTTAAMVPLFARAAGAWVPPGRRFKLILPNGSERVMAGKTLAKGAAPALGGDGLAAKEEIILQVYDQR